jgi:hypothetical protein
MKLELCWRRIAAQNTDDDGIGGLGRSRPRVEPGVAGRGADYERFADSLFRLGFVGSSTNNNLKNQIKILMQ